MAMEPAARTNRKPGASLGSRRGVTDSVDASNVPRLTPRGWRNLILSIAAHNPRIHDGKQPESVERLGHHGIDAGGSFPRVTGHGGNRQVGYAHVGSDALFYVATNLRPGALA